METTLFRHLGFMKYFGLILFFLNLNVGFSQDTLRDQFTPMYSEYYVLHGENSFEYYFNHCTGTHYGKGYIRKNLFRWKFIFDSIQAPVSTYVCSSQTPSDKVNFVFKYQEDSLWYYSGSVKVNQTEYSTGDYTFFVNKSNLNFDEIQIEMDHETKLNLVGLDSTCSEVIVHRPNPWRTYQQSGKNVLRRKKDSFWIIEKTVDLNQEKPWRKGETRKHKHIYKFD